MAWGIWRGCHAKTHWKDISDTNITGINCAPHWPTGVDLNSIEIEKQHQQQLRNEKKMRKLRDLGHDGIDPTITIKQVIQVDPY